LDGFSQEKCPSSLFCLPVDARPRQCYTLITSNREYSGILIEKKQQTMFSWIKKFFSEAITELRHVNWPTRKEATRLTLIVIGIALGLAIFLGAFDYLFSFLLKNFIIA
jgi:preprotein translocase subunit SecE